MEPNLPQETFPTEASRLNSFANFFKSYMSVAAVVTACLPIPVTSWNLIPTFKDQTSLLSVYTSLFCFLLLAFIFYIRHSLARLFFPMHFVKKSVKQERLIKITSKSLGFILPLLFIGLSMRCALFYHQELNSIVGTIENWSRSYARNKQINTQIDAGFRLQDSVRYHQNKVAIDSIYQLRNKYEDSLLRYPHDTLMRYRIREKLSDLYNAEVYYAGMPRRGEVFLFKHQFMI